MTTFPRRRHSRYFRPREYSDKVADAMGEDCAADLAGVYARGSSPLRHLLHLTRVRREDRRALLPPHTEESDP